MPGMLPFKLVPLNLFLFLRYLSVVYAQSEEDASSTCDPGGDITGAFTGTILLPCNYNQIRPDANYVKMDISGQVGVHLHCDSSFAKRNRAWCNIRRIVIQLFLWKSCD